MRQSLSKHGTLGTLLFFLFLLCSALPARGEVWTYACGGDPFANQKSVFDKSEFVCAAGTGLSGSMLNGCGFYPCADLYVMTNRTWSGGEALADVMGSENRVETEMMGGVFGVANQVVIATPAKMFVGEFDIVLDNNLDHKFNGADLVNAAGSGFAFRIIDQGHPPVDPGPMKAGALAISQGASDAIAKWKAGCDLLDAMGAALSLMSGDVVGAAIGVLGNITGIATDYNGAVIAKATDLIGGFDPTTNPQKASGIYGNIAKHWYDLYEDPADPLFTEMVGLNYAAINAELAATSVPESYPFYVKGTDPREYALIKIANRAVEQAALVKALRQSYEKYQGAVAVSNYEYAYRQLEQTRTYSLLLLANLAGFSSDLQYLKDVLTAQGVANTVIKVSDMQGLKDRVAALGLTAEEAASLKAAGFSDQRITLLTQYIVSISVPAADFTMASSIADLAAKADAAYSGIQSFDLGIQTTMNNLSTEFTPHHPKAVAGGPYNGTTGSQVTFDGGGSSDPDTGDTLVYGWDFNGDGVFDDAAGKTVVHTWSKPFSGLIGLKVTDPAGNSSIAYAKVVITASNLPPVITSFTPADKAPRASVKVPLSFTVAADDPEQRALSYQWSVDGAPVGTGTGYLYAPPAGFKGTVKVMVAVRDDQVDNPPAVEARAVTVFLDCDPLDPATTISYYRDLDGDGFGDPSVVTQACAAPAGFVTNKLDCDDSNAAIGQATLRFYRDSDADGLGNANSSVIACSAPAGFVSNSLDCNDADATVGAPSITFYRDFDHDGFGDPMNAQVACSAPAGYVANSLDCNDADPAVGNTLTTYYRDADGDGYGTVAQSQQACLQPAGYVPNSLDCDDTNPYMNPAQKEIVHNGKDDDCSAATPDNYSKSFVLAIDDSSWVYYAKSNGDGTFSNYQRTGFYLGGGTSRGIAIGDFDGDGTLDFIGGRGNGSYYLYSNDGSDNFTYKGIVGTHSNPGGYAMDMTVGDFNNDGLLDFAGNGNTNTCSVFLNDGAGGFTRSSFNYNWTGRGMDAADFNHDGNLDLAVSFYGTNDVWVYLGDGTGKFTGSKVGTATTSAGDNYALAAADFHNDGNTDIIVSGSSNGDAYLLKGKGDGTFLAAVAVPSLDMGYHNSMDAYDYNGDGKADIVLSEYTGYRMYFYPGNGDGTFGPRTAISTANSSAALLAIAAPPSPQPASFPIADAQPKGQTIQVGQSANFNGSFSKDPATIASYSWNFGDAGTGTGAVVDHAYLSEGRFTSMLTVADLQSRTDRDFAQVTVMGAPPVANAGGPYSIGEADATFGRYTAKLDGSASSDDFGIASYQWFLGSTLLDDFEDGNANGWIPAAGTWTVNGGAYEQTNASLSRADTLTGDKKTADYTVETDFRFVSGSGQEALLIFRAQDTDNHYEFIFRGRGLNDLLLYRYVNGGSTQLAQAYLPFTPQLNTTYRLKVEAYKNSIKCYVDGVLYIDATDSTYLNGKVGLTTYLTDVKFDNFTQYSMRTGVAPEFTVLEGSYPVTLKVTDKVGQSASAATQITAAKGSAPVAAAGGPYTFSESFANANKWTVTLDGSGSSDDTGIETYAWSFGDGGTGTGVKPTHVYTGAGTYTVTLTVTDRAGLSNSTTTTVTTKGDAAPIANPGLPYAVDERAASAGKWTVNFDGRASTDDRGIYDYQWRFGDGGTGSGPTPTYQYSAAGVYTVTLTVRDHAFLSHSASTSATVSTNAFPVPRPGGPYSVDESAASGGNWTVALDGSASSDDYGIWKYDWNFGDGSTGTGAKPTHIYAAAGTYKATLTVTDNGKQAQSATVDVVVAGNQPPVPSAGADKITEVGFPVTLDASASTDDFGIYSYKWDPGSPSWSFTPFERTPDGVLITGDYNNWNRYLISNGSAPRNAGDSYTGRVSLQATSNGSRYLMWGLKSVGAGFGMDQYYHALYFNNGAIHVYESNINRGSFGSFANNVSYDVRIDLKASGAVYYYRVTGAADWTKLYESTFSNATPLRLGASLHSGLFLLSDFTTPAGALQLPASPQLTKPLLQATYGAPGSYTAAVTVTDHAQQSVTDAATVTVVPGEAPVAHTGGPYLTNEDIPTRFNARASTDDFGIKSYRWDFGDGEGLSTRNPWVDHRYTQAGVYSVTLTVTDYAGHTSVDSTTATVSANPVVSCVPWQFSGVNEMPHDTWSGKEITLKGVAWSLHPPLTYRWEFGDTTPDATGTATDPRAIQAKHTYNGVDGQPFVATLTVTDALGNSASDQYQVRIRPKSLDIEINLAIDDGLWWLHTNQTRSYFTKGTYGDAVIDAGYWDNAGGWNGDAGGGISGLYTSSPTASAVQAFEVNGHLELGDVRKDPYVETVARGLRFTASRLRQMAIGSQTYGDPDSNGNGLAIETVEARPIYEVGQVMDSILASGSRNTYAITGPSGVMGRSYFDLLTDMVDVYSWGQTDGTGGGGWQYSWNGGIDNSAAQWGAVGLLAAEEVWKIQVPKWVKERNSIWLDYSYDGTGFGYSGRGNGVNTTPSGMVQLAFDDMVGYDDPDTTVDERDPRWKTAEAYIANNWTKPWWFPNSSLNNRFSYYGHYAFAKAMRSAKPKPVVNLAATGLDWYKDNVNGMARRLVNRQQSNGGWPQDQEPGWYVGYDLTNAWSVLILTPTLFVQPPVADAGEDRVWGVDVELTLDGSRSYHLDPFRKIVLYEWDFDGDGVFDVASPDPKAAHTYTRQLYPENTLPRVITVTLRVTDDNDPPKSSTDTAKITIAVPPHPPVAVPGGPYTCFVNVPCALDGSKSFDIDPTDLITLYEWDVNGDRVYGDVTGATPMVTFTTTGIKNIGLRVTDNGVMSPTGRLEAFGFTTATVLQNSTPSANPGGPYTVDEGSTLQLDGSGSTDTDGNALSYSWDLDHDGSFETAGVRPLFSRPDNGLFTVTLKVSDGSLEALRDTVVTVLNVAPAVNPLPAAAIKEGALYAAAGSFTDPGTDSWSATVDYGDGGGVQPLPLSGKAFSLSHVYPRDGVYDLKVTVSDDDGGVGSATAKVTVGNVAPVVNAGPDGSIADGATFTSSGYFTDPGADSWSATVNYGDGGGDQPLPLNPDKTFNLSHIYAVAGSYTVVVTVNDGIASGSDRAWVAVSTTRCLTSLIAKAKSGAVQLNWSAAEHTPTTKYDIYRSTEGASSGFVKVRSGYSNLYPVFTDTGLVNGRTYYYRIEKLQPTGGFCSSPVVFAKPVSLF
ncbi:PKD domain-containing protein [Citrifermentans bremense]|uniref:PKD domain-containing protein n=1 Tax=Citrifermentans bremense TaxID=60035 RepID=UPI0004209BF7|nr:PKD domain-containing protein [Citrifermentans bremense]